MNRSIASFLLVTLLFFRAAVADDRKQLDHNAYDLWNSIDSADLSNDGRWFSYTVRPGKGDGTLIVRDTRSQVEHKIARGIGGRFTKDSLHFVLMIAPDSNALKKARADKVPDDQMPKSEMAMLNLRAGTLKIIQRSRSYEIPKDSSKWIAYLMLADPETKAISSGTSTLQQNLENGERGLELVIPESAISKEKKPREVKKPAPESKSVESRSTESNPTEIKPTEAKPAEARPSGSTAKSIAAGPTGEAKPAQDESKKPSKKKTPGTTMVLLNLESGMETRVPMVTEFEFAESGEKLVYTTSGNEAKDDGVWWVDLTIPFAPKRIAEGKGNYPTGVGIEFTNMPRGQRDILNAYLAAH